MKIEDKTLLDTLPVGTLLYCWRRGWGEPVRLFTRVIGKSRHTGENIVVHPFNMQPVNLRTNLWQVYTDRDQAIAECKAFWKSTMENVIAILETLGEPDKKREPKTESEE